MSPSIFNITKPENTPLEDLLIHKNRCNPLGNIMHWHHLRSVYGVSKYTIITYDSRNGIFCLNDQPLSNHNVQETSITYMCKYFIDFTKFAHKKSNSNSILNKIQQCVLSSNSVEPPTYLKKNNLENNKMKIKSSDIIKNISNITDKYILPKIKTQFGVELLVTNNDIDFANIMRWIKENDEDFLNHISNPHIFKLKHYNDPFGMVRINRDFLFKLDKATYCVVRNIKDNIHGDTLVYSLYIFGRHYIRNYRKLIKTITNNFDNELIQFYVTINYYNANENNQTIPFEVSASNLPNRRLDTLFYENHELESVIRHINLWLKNESIYIDRTILYKTGILLHGSPGTGKTSLILAIANYYQFHVINIKTTDLKYIDIQKLSQAIISSEMKFIIFMEEIDCVFKSRNQETISSDEKAEISAVLQFLDSSISPTNCIFIATTNHLDVLDPALLRSGRFDLIQKISDIGYDKAVEMLCSFGLKAENFIDLFKDNIKYETDKDSLLEDLKRTSYNQANLQSRILNLIESKLTL